MRTGFIDINPRKPLWLAGLTFLAVFGSILAVGLIAVPILIRKTEGRYLQLQADANERQARSLVSLAEGRLKDGADTEAVSRELQDFLSGAEVDRGFSCVVDRGNTEFVCHPLTEAIGMSIAAKEAVFVPLSGTAEPRPWEAAMADATTGAGRLFYPDGEAEVIYMQAIPGTNWTLTTHENTGRVHTELRHLRAAMAGGALLLALLLAIPASLAARAVSRRHEIQIEAEREKSERLLLNILPEPIAERLKAHQSVIADRHSSVTVLFADIVGFTPMAAQISAEDLVRWLNKVFSRFDDICVLYELEKIKTIGDAYMLCGGLEAPPEKAAQYVVAAGLAMIEALSELPPFEGAPALELRVGVHTGEVVAGVIGKRKFSYDLWGDAVNTASRLESSGVPGAIQISKPTATLIQGKFQVRSRGPVAIKGKDEMDTWLVERSGS